jgi:hypothetical protein
MFNVFSRLVFSAHKTVLRVYAQTICSLVFLSFKTVAKSFVGYINKCMMTTWILLVPEQPASFIRDTEQPVPPPPPVPEQPVPEQPVPVLALLPLSPLYTAAAPPEPEQPAPDLAFSMRFLRAIATPPQEPELAGPVWPAPHAEPDLDWHPGSLSQLPRRQRRRCNEEKGYHSPLREH